MLLLLFLPPGFSSKPRKLPFLFLLSSPLWPAQEHRRNHNTTQNILLIIIKRTGPLCWTDGGLAPICTRPQKEKISPNLKQETKERKISKSTRTRTIRVRISIWRITFRQHARLARDGRKFQSAGTETVTHTHRAKEKKRGDDAEHQGRETRRRISRNIVIGRKKPRHTGRVCALLPARAGTSGTDQNGTWENASREKRCRHTFSILFFVCVHIQAVGNSPWTEWITSGRSPCQRPSN